MKADFVRTKTEGTERIVVFKKDDGLHYQLAINSLSDADQAYIAKLEANQSSSSPAVEETSATAMTAFEQTITKHLVRSKGSRTSRVAQGELGSKDYYAIYYSAHWCPPCRTFTPKLVDFYKSAAKQHPNFEIIFVSSDKDEDAMAEYMKETKMPWLALDFDKKKSSRELTQFAGNGIPCLVLVDRNGKVLSDSYVNGKYVGPTKVMNDLKAQLADN